MKKHRLASPTIAAAVIAVAAIGAPVTKPKASPKPPPKPPQPSSDYVGSKLCLECHVKFQKKWPGLPHSKRLLVGKDGKALPPGPQEGCEACHGPGRKHTTDDRKSIIRFGELKAAQKDDICLKCHAPKVTADNWKKSGHAKQEISCVLCHEMHDPADAGKMLRANFDKGCLCHGAIKDKAASGEHHKLPESLSCTSCHTPHGSAEPKGLIKPKTELCKTCHGADAGPMPESHKAADWKKKHGETEDKTSCGACHGKENTCTKCHGGLEMPHPSGWMMGHKGKGASFEADAPCFKCHDKKEFCGRCHADKV